MARFGLVVPGGDGHLNPSFALARKLQQRGHSVLFFSIPDTAKAGAASGLGLVECATETLPQGTLGPVMAKIAWGAAPWQIPGLMTTVHGIYRAYLLAVDQWLTQHPHQIDCLLIDGLSPHLFLLGEHHQIPYVILEYTAPYFLGSRDVPPMMLNWQPASEHRWGRWRNQVMSQLFHRVMTPIISGIQRRYIRAWKLPKGYGLSNSREALARITQVPECFDFAHKTEPDSLYAGPWTDTATRPQLMFPWERLNGQPMIYGALGTVYTQQERAYGAIAQACHQLTSMMPHQLVLSVGPQVSNNFLKDLEITHPTAIFVRKAPQVELLQKADLFITHAGMNSTLEALQAGVPMVALPIGGDQPGVAARIVYHGLGVSLKIKRLTATGLAEAIYQVWKDDGIRGRARAIAKELRQDQGLERAADLIERRLSSVLYWSGN